MNYHLSFLDDDGRVQDVREGVFETDDTAKRWMRIVGEAWARDYECALMEFWAQERRVARVQRQAKRFLRWRKNTNALGGLT
jgi:hypothetical protein